MRRGGGAGVWTCGLLWCGAVRGPRPGFRALAVPWIGDTAPPWCNGWHTWCARACRERNSPQRARTRSSGLLLDLDRRLAAGQLRRPAVLGDEVLGVLARDRVGHLHGRRLHQVRRRRLERAADAVVQRELAAAHGVGDDARRVRRVPHLELHLDVQRHVAEGLALDADVRPDRKSTRLNSSHANISYAVFCLKKKKTQLNSILVIL